MPDGERVIYRAEVTTQSGSLNVRSGNGTQYPIIDRLPKGEIVDVMVVCPNGWCYIDDDGEQGYVDGRYLTPVSSPEPSKPADDKTPAEDEDKPQIVNYGVLIPCETKEAAEALASFFCDAVVISGDEVEKGD